MPSRPDENIILMYESDLRQCDEGTCETCDFRRSHGIFPISICGKNDEAEDEDMGEIVRFQDVSEEEVKPNGIPIDEVMVARGLALEHAVEIHKTSSYIAPDKQILKLADSFERWLLRNAEEYEVGTR